MSNESPSVTSILRSYRAELSQARTEAAKEFQMLTRKTGSYARLVYLATPAFHDDDGSLNGRQDDETSSRRIYRGRLERSLRRSAAAAAAAHPIGK